MDQAGVGAGGEGVRAVGGHRRFGGHAGVRDGVGAAALSQAVALGHAVGVSDGLEQLDGVPVAQHGRSRQVLNEPLARRPAVTPRGERGVVTDPVERDVGVESGGQPLSGRVPVRFEALGQDRDLDPLLVVAGIDGEAGAVEPAVAHLRQHA